MGKFLFLSGEGAGLGIAYLLAQTHEVAVFCNDERVANDLEGWVARDDDWGFDVDMDSLFISDCTGSGILLDALRHRHARVVGGSYLADRLEMDRAYSTEIMRLVGINTPRSKSFSDWDSGVAYATKRGDDVRLVFKPSGRLSGVIPSYVSSGLDDLLGVISHYRSTTPGVVEYSLQDYIEGTDVSTEGWFDGRRFVRPFNHTLEQKSLMNENKGPSGGCTGNVVWAVEDDRLTNELLKIETFLRDSDYGPGCIDLNALVSEDGDIFGLEWTPRFGYDATPTLLYQLFDGDFGQWLLDGMPEPMPLRDGFAAGVRLTVPPWPSEKAETAEGLPFQGIDDFIPSFYPYSIKRSQDGFIETSGGYGSIGVALGRGDSFRGAIRQAYKVADKIKVPDLQYRTDLDEEFKEDIEILDAAKAVA